MKHLPTLPRLAMTAVAASAVAMAIGGVSIAHAGGAHASQHRMTLTEVQTGSAFVSISHTKGGKPGDGFIFHSKLSTRAGKQVGTLDAECILVLMKHTLCTGVFTLPGGTVSGTALIPDNNGPVRVAVTGGTGRYATVRGQVTSHSTGENTSRDVFELDY